MAATTSAPTGIQAPVYEKFDPQNAGQYRFINAGTTTVFLGTAMGAAEATAAAVAPTAGNPTGAIVLVPGAVNSALQRKHLLQRSVQRKAATVYITPGQGL